MKEETKTKGTLSSDGQTIIHNGLHYNVLLKSITGSRLYGTQYELGEHPFDPEYVSDFDFRGLFIGKTEDRLSLIENVPEQIEINDEEDTVFYDILKFFQLSIDNNPNIMDILFSDEDSILFSTEIGRSIFANRHLFISQKSKDSFNGYAMQQLYRMKQHHRWSKTYPEIYTVEKYIKTSFDNQEIDFQWIADYFSGVLAAKISNETAQEHKHLDNTISMEDFIHIHNIDFNLYKFIKPHAFDYLKVKDKSFHPIQKQDGLKELFTNDAVYSKLNETIFLVHEIKSANSGIFTRSGNLRPSAKKIPSDSIPSFVVSFNISDFKRDCKEISSIWDWKVNRNEKRAKLEERFGYDVKHGMHLYRLLISAKKLLITGTYTPKLSAEDLSLAKDILAGKITYEDIISMAESLSKELNDIVKSGKSPLPETADLKAINELLLSIYRKF